jgi:hypothetical protein
MAPAGRYLAIVNHLGLVLSQIYWLALNVGFDRPPCEALN